jgi:cell division protein FtsB
MEKEQKYIDTVTKANKEVLANYDAVKRSFQLGLDSVIKTLVSNAEFLAKELDSLKETNRDLKNQVELLNKKDVENKKPEEVRVVDLD